MIAVITVLDEETGKVYIKEQPIKPIRVEDNPMTNSTTFSWQFKFNFANEYGGEAMLRRDE